MYIIYNKKTKQYLKKDWDRVKGNIYTHEIDEAKKYETFSEAYQSKESETEDVELWKEDDQK